MDSLQRQPPPPPLLLLVLVLLLSVSSRFAAGIEWDGVAITQNDLQGLQAIKAELTDRRGVLRSWNGTGIDACSGAWAGIKCVRGQVIAIQLPWRGLDGRLSDKVGQLVSLRKLNLHDNAIGGPVPPALGRLRELRGVYLFNNRFAGEVPPSIAGCALLQTLDLSTNSLSGSIPASIVNNTRLLRLNLSYNNISGSIPVAVTRLPALVFVSLQHNNLTGSVPDTWGSSSSNNVSNFQLKSLHLEHNFLSGGIPISLSRLRMLEDLSLSNNELQGSIPEEFGRLSRLKTLDLSKNSISGPFPAPLCNLSSLVELKLEGNSLKSPILESIEGLKNLSLLDLKRNQFVGPIPPTLGNISGLSLLDLSENNLTGGIPVSIDNLTNLTFFNVSDNNLSGPVPVLLSEKFNSSSFSGNLQLCGYSAAPCPSAPPTYPQSPSTSPEHTRRRLSTKALILIAVAIFLALLFLLFSVLFYCMIRNRAAKQSTAREVAARRGEKSGQETGSEVETGGDTGGKLVHFDGPLAFTADDLLCATAEIMGKSTYGTVYKATLEDGSQVAVKRLREKIAKGQKEFEAEVGVLGRIRHPNLLALRAFYLGPKGEKLLVFDFMAKGSLAAFLHARAPDSMVDWPTRMRIAMGITRGLHHLHTELAIVHGNLTSTNVLLDESCNARISDYGFGRLVTGTAASSSNVVAAAGAAGYRAPELAKLKKANAKSDVYSLGMILLELLTGKPPADSTNGMDLPQWVASIVKEEWTNEVFDTELMRDAAATGDDLLNTLNLALHCVDPSPAARPEVQQVMQQLEEIKPDLAEPSETEGEAPKDDDE